MHLQLDWNLEIPKNIEALVPYAPGKPIAETQREYGIQEVIKLASNENPLGPSPVALEVIKKNLKELNLYPDGSHFELKAALSKHLNCQSNELSIGCGSNEFIDLIPRVFVSKQHNIVTHKTAFIIYKLCAQLQGCECIEAEVDENLQVCVDDLLQKVNADTKVVFLANPNNPTGAFLKRDEIERIASALYKKKILFVLDYAYWEYVEESEIPDPMEMYRKFPNVIVLRTFSKIYGLAGLRVGYMVADPKVIAAIEKSRQPFNVNALALSAAAAALSDQNHVRQSIDLNQSEKARLYKDLQKYPVHIFKGEGNFILIDLKKDSKILYPEFLKQGVIIRPVAGYGLKTHFRVSIGLPSENQKFLNAMDKIKWA